MERIYRAVLAVTICILRTRPFTLTLPKYPMTEDDDFVERRARKRRQSEARRRYAALGVMALLAVGIAVVGIVAINRVRDRAAAERGAQGAGGNPKTEWNHSDLAAHLAAKGIKVRVRGGGASPFPNSIASELVEDGSGFSIDCYLTPDGQQARDAAASLGQRAAAWGRFVMVEPIGSNPGDLKRRVLAALP